MAHSIAKAFKANLNDELYTPRVLVEALEYEWQNWYLTFMSQAIENLGYHGLGSGLKFLADGHLIDEVKPVVWLPFDTEDSEFFHYFKDRGVPVEVSHLSMGESFDFFKYEPRRWDIAVSNPPFSRKLDVFKRLYSLRKPWAMVMNTMALNYMEIGNFFADNPVQLLIPDKRVSYDGNPSSFNSCYVCRDFLRRDLQFCHLPHCNIGKDFVPSRMYKGTKSEDTGDTDDSD